MNNTFHVRKGDLQNIRVPCHLYMKDKPENEIHDGAGTWGRRMGKE